MSIQAQTIYKDQFIAGFERRQSVLRQAVTTDTENRGGSVVFLVATSGASGGRSAVTRGSDGLIPASDDSQSQVTVTFAEDHDLVRRTGFDIFKAQGNQLDIMRMNGMAVINRKMDARIIAAAEATTVDLGAQGTMSKTVANKIATKLRNAFVGEDLAGMIFSIITPAAWSYLTDVSSFSNSQYVNFGNGEPPVVEGIPVIGRWKHWMGINWAEHSGLTGIGTATATCLAWHKAALGHAIAPGGIDAKIDRNEEHDYSFARHSAYNGAKLLQNAGVVKFTHDDSGLS